MASVEKVEIKPSRTRLNNGAERPMYNEEAFNSDLDDSPPEYEPESTKVKTSVSGKQLKVFDCVFLTFPLKSRYDYCESLAAFKF